MTWIYEQSKMWQNALPSTSNAQSLCRFSATRLNSRMPRKFKFFLFGRTTCEQLRWLHEAWFTDEQGNKSHPRLKKWKVSGWNRSFWAWYNFTCETWAKVCGRCKSMSERVYVTTPHSTRQEFTKGKLHNSFATKTEPCRQ